MVISNMARNSARGSVDLGKGVDLGKEKMSRRWSHIQDSLHSFSDKVQQPSRERQSHPAVQARSLGWLHELADAPTHDLSGRMPTGAEVLVLYICPVPGSNDIFLSPMKPSQDRITPEDIASAMYILHQEDAEDFQTKIHDGEPARATDGQSTANQRANAVFNIQRKPLKTDSMESNESSESPIQQQAPLIQRKAVRSDTSPDRRSHVGGARLPEDQISSTGNGARSSFNMIQSDIASGLRMALPIEEFRNLYGVSLLDRGLLGVEDTPMSLCRKRSDSTAAVVSRIVDPKFASQSNRGRNRKPQEHEKGPMYIDVLTKGYTGKEMDTAYIPGHQSAHAFTRRVAPDKCSPTSPKPREDDKAPNDLRGGREIPDDNEQNEQGRRVTWRTLMQKLRPYTHAALGFGFQSPWSMRCEFVPAFRDNVIKCVCDSGTLSELRYHIVPTSDKTSLSPARGSGELDLSLGRAALGGGSTGELAKLAKLVVYPEGMKMLDLLVSANMLVFQRTKNDWKMRYATAASPRIDEV